MDEEVPPEQGPKRLVRRHQGSPARNSGWYIPYWRKPKRSAQDQLGDRGERRRRSRPRTDLDLDRVREEWVARYSRHVRRLSILGLSVGTPNEDVKQRYEMLRRELERRPEDNDRLDAVVEAYNGLRVD